MNAVKPMFAAMIRTYGPPSTISIGRVSLAEAKKTAVTELGFEDSAVLVVYTDPDHFITARPASPGARWSQACTLWGKS